nr:oligosaccharide flippase family protein [Angustibacter aerolatus]
MDDGRHPGLLGYASNNTDSLIIGHRFGAQPLGLYSRAYRLLFVPLSQVRAPSTTVALPVLSRLQDDPVRYASFLRRGQIALGYTLVAGVAIAAGASVPLIDVFLGDRWAAVSPLFRILAFAGIFQTLAYVGYWVYLSRALTGALLRYTIVTSLLKVGLITLGSHWGITGVALGFAAGPALAWPISLWRLSRITDIPLGGLYRGAGRVLAMALLAGGATWGVCVAAAALPSLVTLLLGALTGVAVYALGALALRPIRADVLSVVDILRQAVASRRKPTPA